MWTAGPSTSALLVATLGSSTQALAVASLALPALSKALLLLLSCNSIAKGCRQWQQSFLTPERACSGDERGHGIACSGLWEPSVVHTDMSCARSSAAALEHGSALPARDTKPLLPQSSSLTLAAERTGCTFGVGSLTNI